jgi:glycosyltransferase involved in cell wall biosynthesis
MISIVTGTLNRLHFLPKLIETTVHKNDFLELILVDGGSNDGTQEYIKSLKNDRIKLIEIGKRSSYPHFMNIGIENAKFDYICQWNDDALLVNEWSEVLEKLDNEHDFYIFNWKYGNLEDMKNPDWISGIYHENTVNKGWCIVVDINNQEIIMNYGIYNKKIFKEIGMYYPEFNYYYADGDMSMRSFYFNFKLKELPEIRVCSLYTHKNAIQTNSDYKIYQELLNQYKNLHLNNNHIFLK